MGTGAVATRVMPDACRDRCRARRALEQRSQAHARYRVCLSPHLVVVLLAEKDAASNISGRFTPAVLTLVRYMSVLVLIPPLT